MRWQIAFTHYNLQILRIIFVISRDDVAFAYHTWTVFQFIFPDFLQFENVNQNWP